MISTTLIFCFYFICTTSTCLPIKALCVAYHYCIIALCSGLPLSVVYQYYIKGFAYTILFVILLYVCSLVVWRGLGGA